MNNELTPSIEEMREANKTKNLCRIEDLYCESCQ